jgi:Type II CAAX prenyl endopeptidase Rce1-like
MIKEGKMNTALSFEDHLSKRAAWVMLLLWLVYTLVYTLPFEKNLEAVLEAMAGSLAFVVLLAMGFRKDELYLQLKPVSPRGLIALGLATLALTGPLATSSWSGVHWLPLLVYAPLNGVSQELFFRAGLLPVIQRLCNGKTWSALILQAVLFGLWHVPLAFIAAPINPWVAVVALFVVTSLGGLAWGWQAQHDRTVVWTMLHHTLLLMVMSLFGL